MYTSRATAILVDVVVRDKKGGLITGLRQTDFEVLEDGVAQKIGSFSIVNRGGGIGIGVKFRQPGGTTVLVGLETDVCVAQSALGLAAAGYRVAVIDDACGSPAPNHAAGLRRLRDAGVVVTNTKGIFYEWVRDLAVHGKVLGAIGREPPPGVRL